MSKPESQKVRLQKEHKRRMKILHGQETFPERFIKQGFDQPKFDIKNRKTQSYETVNNLRVESSTQNTRPKCLVELE